MKRIALIAVFVVLLFVEAFFLSGLLPQRWQESFSERLQRMWPRPAAYDYSRITHPALDKEIEQAFGGPRTYAVIGYGVFGMLSIANGLLIVVVWRGIKRH